MTGDERAEARYDRDEDPLREGIATGDLDDRGRLNEAATATPNRPGGERPESDADQLREAAGWLDTMDAMARAFFDMVQRSTLPEEMRERALSLIPDVSSDEVQVDLRRIADLLDAQSAPVPSYPSSDERPDYGITDLRHVRELATCADVHGRVLVLPRLLNEMCNDIDLLRGQLEAARPAPSTPVPAEPGAEQDALLYGRGYIYDGHRLDPRKMKVVLPPHEVTAPPALPVPEAHEAGHISPTGWNHNGPASECHQLTCTDARPAPSPTTDPEADGDERVWHCTMPRNLGRCFGPNEAPGHHACGPADQTDGAS